MKKLLAGMVVLASLTSASVRADELYNPPPEGECLTNWYEFVECLTNGSVVFTNINILPGTLFCLGATFSAEAQLSRVCGQAKVRQLWAPQTTSCLPSYHTNSFCPVSQTNWCEIHGPNFNAFTNGLSLFFTPASCGDYTVTFHAVWTNPPPCTNCTSCSGGSTSISTNFTVVNVDIAEANKTIYVCDTTSFALTNTCGGVTWEVSPAEPGGPYVNGSTIVAATNGGIWTVIARSTINNTCMDSATLTLVYHSPNGLTGGNGLQVYTPLK